MRYILENEIIKIELCDEGGELYRIYCKKDNIDYLWNGRKFGWPLSAPTLFPIIGKVKERRYILNGKSFEMLQHGFASWGSYEVIDKTNNSITFELLYNEDYLKIYPFKFSLKVTYSIDENNINVDYKVVNLDQKPILFSIGGHPCFRCQVDESEKLDDYYLEFNQIESRATVMCINEDDFLTGEEEIYLEDTNIINLNENTFKRGTLIFNNLKSNSISLKSRVSKREVTVEFDGFPYLALWAPDRNTHFVCLEPWFGHADYQEFNDDFSKKEGILSLEEGEQFKCNYNIKIGLQD